MRGRDWVGDGVDLLVEEVDHVVPDVPGKVVAALADSVLHTQLAAGVNW